MDADAYFQIPQFISALHDCSIYVLLLTALSADLMTGRKGKTSWIHDEFQHAARLTNAGRLVMVPVLLESTGTTDAFTRDNSIDLTANPRDFDALNGMLTPAPLALDDSQVAELSATVARFDALFLGEQWDAAAEVLQRSEHLAASFDHQFRRMLHAMYTADAAGLQSALDRLHAAYGQQIVFHLYKGYCAKHGIPNTANK